MSFHLCAKCGGDATAHITSPRGPLWLCDCHVAEFEHCAAEFRVPRWLWGPMHDA